MLDVGCSYVRTCGHWTLDVGHVGHVGHVGRIGRIGRVGRVGRVGCVERWTLDVITVTNHAMMTHDHLCFPTNFVDNCSYIDFVIIGCELKATIEWRVFLKMTRQVYLVVRLFALCSCI